jgi:prepilin-type N-terminal cleavage/methylation domain-containing protein
MKGRSVLRRRRAARGFTLMELMVVVMLVAILAMIATPSMTEARNDRIAFDYASRYQQLLVKARARAAGTGSAHLRSRRARRLASGPKRWSTLLR